MDRFIRKSNLSINLWLIKCGLIRGQLNNGIIKSTKFGLVNQWFSFLLVLFNCIKWTIQLFSPKGSEMANLLGNWGIFLGPKIIVDLIIIIAAIYLLVVMLLFHLASKNPKMMFWLESFEFDNETRNFSKLDLNQSNSKMLIQRMALLRLIWNLFIYSFIPFFVAIEFYCIFKYQKNYKINYIISILIFCPQIYISLSYIFGLLIIFHLVSHSHI